MCGRWIHVSMTELLRVQSSLREYPVYSFHHIDAITKAIEQDASAFLFIDKKVWDIHFAKWNCQVPKLLFDAHEENKTFDALSPYFDYLIRHQIKKNSTLYVIGGGVTQDVGAFIASNLYRGIRLVLIPTTLLAQADSCIGAKNSINYKGYKNLLGNFYAPHEVWLSSEFLTTLSKVDLLSGMGEIVKLDYINGTYPEMDFDGLLRSPQSMHSHVLRSLKIKQGFIEEDEFDRNRRNLLNFGHTFGHAFESVSQYQIPHGTAVVLGMLAATFVSCRLGLAPKSLFENAKKMWSALYQEASSQVRIMDVDALISLMKLDKKNTDNDIQFILTKESGMLFKQKVAADSNLKLWLKEFLGAI